MKITETLPADMYKGSWELVLSTTKGDKYINFGKGEPEDMCIARDLNDCLKIANMLELAYNAGKNGEIFEKEVFIGEEEN